MCICIPCKPIPMLHCVSVLHQCTLDIHINHLNLHHLLKLCRREDTQVQFYSQSSLLERNRKHDNSTHCHLCSLWSKCNFILSHFGLQMFKWQLGGILLCISFKWCICNCKRTKLVVKMCVCQISLVIGTVTVELVK